MPAPNLVANPLVETLHAGAFIVWEPPGPGFHCREKVAIGANQNLQAGQILTATGVAIAVGGAGADAAMILFDGIVTDANPGEQVAIVRGPCDIRESDLTYYAGVTQGHKDAVKAALLDLGIVLR